MIFRRFMRIIKYLIQFIIICILYIIFKIIGVKFSSFLSGKLFEIIGPIFRSKKIIDNNIRKAFPNYNCKELNNIIEYIHNIDANINIYQGEYIPLNINEFEKDDKYLVFSGIGNHKTFISMLKKYNINIVKEIEFPDHYIYLQKEIDEIISISKNLNCKIMTTEKDYMRLNNNNEIFYIKSELKIINQENFVNYISKIYEDN